MRKNLILDIISEMKLHIKLFFKINKMIIFQCSCLNQNLFYTNQRVNQSYSLVLLRHQLLSVMSRD